jgi:cytochrome c-type biogenesis protein CcmF
MNIQYIGEHLLPGEIGKLFVWLGFGAAILSSVFYLLSFYAKENRGLWLKSARSLYLVHAVSVIAVSAVLYFIIFRHYFEYSYVWQYSSRALPVKYIISCFWAGQEGSFLVWGLWQALVGLVLLKLARKWEAPVMTVFSLSQAFVTSMLLGTTLLGVKIGGSPFDLLRETVATIDGTIFTMPDYLTMVGDGNGLNPLLENIWMTIHPPILFLGYALALVPFSYAIASFLMKDYQTWIGRALPWTLFAILMLGAGILLGGAWAYVSLTFGGFWAWDPVENSSLVPWMTLVAGLHFMLISRRQNYAMFAAYVMLTLSYVLVLYASFLTRSGVLADTSAHSFGDNGMTMQLLIYLLTFFVIMVVMISVNYKKINVTRQDILLSREFWMFIGAIIILLAAFQIIFTTSIPVFNSLFNTDIAPPADRIGFYNRWQMPYALLVAGFIAFSQFLTYDTNDPGQFLKKMVIPLGVAVVVCAVLVFTGVVTGLNFILLVFFTLFALFASLYNMIFLKTRPANAAAIITHIGFVLFVLGAVITFSNSTVISSNSSKFDLGSQKDNAENLVLMRNDTVLMSGYYVSYVSNATEGNTTVYRVDFLTQDKGKFNLAFSLYPSVNAHPKMGAVYNPATRHFPWRDFYTYIAIVSKDPDYIVIKAIMNPYINILWLGCLVMTGGFALAFAKRARKRWLWNP